MLVSVPSRNLWQTFVCNPLGGGEMGRGDPGPSRWPCQRKTDLQMARTV